MVMGLVIQDTRLALWGCCLSHAGAARYETVSICVVVEVHTGERVKRVSAYRGVYKDDMFHCGMWRDRCIGGVVYRFSKMSIFILTN